MDTIVEELYHALCRTDTSTAHISDELWEKASAQAGEEAIAELRRLSREQLLDAERPWLVPHTGCAWVLLWLDTG